jgi:hypothetical protein
VLQELRWARPEWLPQQRRANDIVTATITRRRTRTPDMRDLAAFMRLPPVRPLPCGTRRD